MNKTIKVLLPIEVSDSIFCFDAVNRIKCPHFTSGDCGLNFKPRFERSSGKYLKDKYCSSLIWEENVK